LALVQARWWRFAAGGSLAQVRWRRFAGAGSLALVLVQVRWRGFVGNGCAFAGGAGGESGLPDPPALVRL